MSRRTTRTRSAWAAALALLASCTTVSEDPTAQSSRPLFEDPTFNDLHELVHTDEIGATGCILWNDGSDHRGNLRAKSTCFATQALPTPVRIFPSGRVDPTWELLEVDPAALDTLFYSGNLEVSGDHYIPSQRFGNSRIGGRGYPGTARIPKGLGDTGLCSPPSCVNAVRFAGCTKSLQPWGGIECTHRTAIVSGHTVDLESIRERLPGKSVGVVALNCFPDLLNLLFGWQQRYPASPASISDACAATGPQDYFDPERLPNTAAALLASLPPIPELPQPPPPPAPAAADNNLPFGYLDSADGTGHVTGWAADWDQPGKALGIHVYAGNAFVGSGTAGLYRPDVNAVFPGLGTHHGFDFTVALPSGQQTVCAYAINAEGGDTRNQSLGCLAVTVGQTDYGACAPPGTAAGRCIDTTLVSCDAARSLYAGYCGGGAQVQCCAAIAELPVDAPPPPKEGVGVGCGIEGVFSGSCIDTSSTSCGGTLLSGYCSGPAEVKCCGNYGI